MKKQLYLSILSLLTLCACSAISTSEASTSQNNNSIPNNITTSQASVTPNTSTSHTTSSSITSTSNSSSSVSSPSSTSIDLSDAVEVDGTDIVLSNDSVLITKAGVYTISGTLENGQIIVNAGDEDVVEITLNNVNVSCNYGSPIYILNADKVEISSPKGCVSSINDLRSEKESDDEDEAGDAAIYSECDLKFKGNGTLNVTASYNNGIHTKDDLKIKNETLNVTAPNNALKGNDSITVESGKLTIISTKGDALKTKNSHYSEKSQENKGTIDIQAGTLNLYSACDGIDASYDVTIGNETSSPTINIFTDKYSSYSQEVTDTSETELYIKVNSSYYSTNYRYAALFSKDDGTTTWENATYYTSQNTSSRPGSSSSTSYYYKLNKPSNYQYVTLYRFTSSSSNSTESYNAKSETKTISNTSDMFSISSISSSTINYSWSSYSSAPAQGGPGGTGRPGGMQDGNQDKGTYSTKGIKSNNKIIINSGEINIKSYDDGIHVDGSELLDNGAYGVGLIQINGGNTTIYSNDDGIHSDIDFEINDGQINVTNSYEGIEGNRLYFKGGTSIINSNDDGINAAGSKYSPSIQVTDGLVDVTVPSGDTDAIDSNGTFTQTGGLVIARSGARGNTGGSLDCDSTVLINGGTFIGIGGIASTPSSSSTNCLARFSSISLTANTYTISDDSNELFSFETATSYSALWISSDSFKLSTSYKLANSSSTVKSWTQSSKTMSL